MASWWNSVLTKDGKNVFFVLASEEFEKYIFLICGFYDVVICTVTINVSYC